MLADSVEAAARSLRDPSVSRLRSIVNSIVEERFKKGELDECPLTLRDLNLIKESFERTLNGVFHGRVKYAEEEPASRIARQSRDQSLHLCLQSQKRRLFCHKRSRARLCRMLQAVWGQYAGHSASPTSAAVQLNFVNTDVMCRLHEEYFADPTVTDVITFPLVGPGLAGEIYICGDVAIARRSATVLRSIRSWRDWRCMASCICLALTTFSPQRGDGCGTLERRFLKQFSFAKMTS